MRDALSGRGDLELRFQAGPSIRVHSQKMSLASSVLQTLMDDVKDEQIASAKRKRVADPNEGASLEHVPSLQVSSMLHGTACRAIDVDPAVQLLKGALGHPD